MTATAIARVVIAALLVSIPGTAAAQSGIAGVVRDTSGAVLPGVTVEAASPALIEKVRTAVTDGEGTYRILDLRPGAYTVTFSLTGFSTVRRDGIDLPASFTATVSVDMAVGAVEETVTVSGAAPLVDVQNVTSQNRLSQELLEALPANRSPQGFVGLTPGITSQGIGGVPDNRDEMNTAVHGASAGESVYLIDGMNTAEAQSLGGGGNVFRVSQAYVAEINVVVGGGTAEQQFGGTVSNVIPKEGGNTFTGSLYGEYAGQGLVTNSNLTDELRAQGFTAGSLSNLRRRWDVSPAVGGRLMRDKLWFFASYKNSGTLQTRPGMFDNLTPRGWAYTPDVNRPALAKITSLSRNARLTWQATPRNKISVFADAAPVWSWQRMYQHPISPEATLYSPYLPNALMIASWKSPVTSRFLLDAAVARNSVDFVQRRQTTKTCLCSAPDVGFDIVATKEATTNLEWRANSANGPGLQHYGHFANNSMKYQANASYVTGTHAAKAGMQILHGYEYFTYEPNGGLAYTLRNGLPSQIVQYANPVDFENQIRPEIGVYVQDQWTRRRLTLTGGVRWDYINIGAGAFELPAGLWVSARSFPRTTHSPQWSDVSPRMAASFDLFGDGKTALKATIGRFIAAQGAGAGGINNSNPVVRSVLSVTRTWNDANANFSPDCDLKSQLANGECGQISDLNFGGYNPNATTFNPELLSGFRNNNWETTAVLQRQLANGVSVTVGYYRRSFANFLANDNLLVAPGDFSQYCITAPVDSRLPGGGGNQMCGLYDVIPARFGQNRTVVERAAKFGDQKQIYDGVDVTESIRLAGGTTISGGVNWGRTKTDTCFTIDSPGALRFCETVPPMQISATFVGLVPLPWWGLLASATYRDYPGAQILANYVATNAQIVPSLGRNLSSGVNGTVTIPLIEPGTMYGERPRQLDFRVSKRHRIGRTRIMGNLDLFNMLNATGVNAAGGGAGLNATYGPQWLRPLQLQQGRFIKLSAQLDF
jgi:hypothetical protein